MLGNLKKVTYWCNETLVICKRHVEIVLRHEMWQITYTFVFTILIRIPLLVTSYWSHLMKVTSFRSLLDCSLCLGKNSWIFHTLIFNQSTLRDHYLFLLSIHFYIRCLVTPIKVTLWHIDAMKLELFAKDM